MFGGVTKKEFEELSTTFLEALKQQKEELVEMINKKQETLAGLQLQKSEEEDLCLCFIGTNTGFPLPPEVSQAVSNEIKAITKKYGIRWITALFVEKNIGMEVMGRK